MIVKKSNVFGSLSVPAVLSGLSLLIIFTGNLLSQTAANNPIPIDSTKQVARDSAKVIEEIPMMGLLSEEERQFYQADAFPISLLNRGRQATTGYRGMPPGFLSFEFAGHQLSNPVTGFWNEQWLPIYQVWERWRRFGSLVQSLAPGVPVTPKPLTRIIFSQDYAIGLSFLDINFTRRINKTDYVHLSGSNFLGDGSEPFDYSRFKVNTYRVQWHKNLTNRWNFDAFFWQMRHAFNLGPETGSIRDKFKQIGNIGWLTLHGRLSQNDSLIIEPSYLTVVDKYSKSTSLKRRNRYHIFESDLKYIHQYTSLEGGVQIHGRFTTNKGKDFPITSIPPVVSKAKRSSIIFNNPPIWPRRNETGFKVLGFLNREEQGFNYQFKGGVSQHSAIGLAALGLLSVEKKISKQSRLGFSAFSIPQSPSLLWRSVEHDTIPQYANKSFIQKQGFSFLAETFWGNSFNFSVEPFAYRSQNYPLFDDAQRKWQPITINNYGLRIQTGWEILGLQLLNDFTFNQNYQEAFAPQINNISTARVSLRLFNNALKLDGIFNWHYIGFFHVIDFDRLLNQYRPGDLETGPFYIGDFRLQAHFRDATVFFIWENVLSEDYLIINNTLESLFVFRLGIDWLLFN